MLEPDASHTVIPLIRYVHNASLFDICFVAFVRKYIEIIHDLFGPCLGGVCNYCIWHGY